MKYLLKKADYGEGGGKSLNCTADKIDSWILKQINEKCIIPTIKRENVNGIMKFSSVSNHKNILPIVNNVVNSFFEVNKEYVVFNDGNEFAVKLNWSTPFSNEGDFISLMVVNKQFGELFEVAISDLQDLNILMPENFKTKIDLENEFLSVEIRLVFDNIFEEYVLEKLQSLGFSGIEAEVL